MRHGKKFQKSNKVQILGFEKLSNTEGISVPTRHLSYVVRECFMG